MARNCAAHFCAGLVRVWAGPLRASHGQKCGEPELIALIGVSLHLWKEKNLLLYVCCFLFFFQSSGLSQPPSPSLGTHLFFLVVVSASGVPNFIGKLSPKFKVVQYKKKQMGICSDKRGDGINIKFHRGWTVGLRARSVALGLHSKGRDFFPCAASAVTYALTVPCAPNPRIRRLLATYCTVYLYTHKVIHPILDGLATTAGINHDQSENNSHFSDGEADAASLKKKPESNNKVRVKWGYGWRV
jgi:hypothetical protein